MSMIGRACSLAALFAMPMSAHAQGSDRAQAASAEIGTETITIPAIDERPITFYLDRPETSEKLPILLVVDGSGCKGQRRKGFADLYQPTADDTRAFARLMVEKPGVEAGSDDAEGECTADFLKHYTMSNRVLDHMRVLQHLHARADWWNGELLVWGWSDGGDVASQLVVYYPEITRAVLGAAGGGYTMAEHFEDFWVCKNDDEEERAGCLASLRAEFSAMEDNPTWKETWSGHDNSWRTWASRLRSRLSGPLADNTTPILLLHGELDYDGTPVDSARKLVSDLEEAGNDAFTYWEVAGMGHGWSKLPVERRAALERAMLDWLLLGKASEEDIALIVAPAAPEPATAGDS